MIGDRCIGRTWTPTGTPLYFPIYYYYYYYYLLSLYYYYNRLISKKKWWGLEMQFHFIVVWLHLKIWNSTCVYQKRGGCLWPIAIAIAAVFFILLFYYFKLYWARSKQIEIYQGSYKKLRPFFKDFSRITLDFQGPPTRNTIYKIVKKCTFPVCSNKSLRLELFASSCFSLLVLNWYLII